MSNRDINNALITHRSWDSLLHAVSGALQRAVSLDGCALSLYLPDQDVFRLTAVETPSSDYFVAGRELKPAENSVGWVFEHSSPLSIATSNKSCSIQMRDRSRPRECGLIASSP